MIFYLSLTGENPYNFPQRWKTHIKTTLEEMVLYQKPAWWSHMDHVVSHSWLHIPTTSRLGFTQSEFNWVSVINLKMSFRDYSSWVIVSLQFPSWGFSHSNWSPPKHFTSCRLNRLLAPDPPTWNFLHTYAMQIHPHNPHLQSEQWPILYHAVICEAYSQDFVPL